MAVKALKASGHAFALSKPKASGDEAAQRAEAKHKNKVEVLRLASSRAIEKIVAKAQTKQPDGTFWRLGVDALAEGSWHKTIASVAKRRGWVEKKQRPEEILQRDSPRCRPASYGRCWSSWSLPGAHSRPGGRSLTAGR